MLKQKWPAWLAGILADSIEQHKYSYSIACSTPPKIKCARIPNQISAGLLHPGCQSHDTAPMPQGAEDLYAVKCVSPQSAVEITTVLSRSPDMALNKQGTAQALHPRNFHCDGTIHRIQRHAYIGFRVEGIGEIPVGQGRGAPRRRRIEVR